MAVVLGKPSAAMATELSNKEKEREAEQAKNLGEEGLKKLADILEAAMAKNESPIPEEILTSLPVPDLNKVPSIPLFTARLSPGSLSLDVIPESVRGVSTEDVNAILSRLKSDAEKSKSMDAPFHADLTHIESAFVFAAVGVDTTPLSSEQRLYLPILDEILFKLPADLDDGKRITKEEFVNQIHDETVSFSCGVGLLGGSIPQMAYVSVQTDNTDGNGLHTALKWIKRALYQTEITGEAVKTAVQRLISEISPQIRHGPSVASTVASELMFDSEKSNTVACNVIRQKPFLAKMFKKVGGKLEDEDMEEEGDVEEEAESAPIDDSGLQDIVKELENIRKVLFQTTNYHAFVAANLNNIPNVVASVVSSLSHNTETSTSGRLIDNVSASSVRRSKTTSEAGGGDGAVCSLSAIESGFLNVITNGIKPYDPNRPALLVSIEYLTALEGMRISCANVRFFTWLCT
jgi:Zn-dependent M16 (insulinase) family peptidase